MFKITGSKGFHITFGNGWTASVQFGPGNYAGNYNMSFDYLMSDKPVPEFSSPTAEIAAFPENGAWHEFEDDTVKGYCTPAEVLEFLNMVAAKPAIS